MREPDRASTLPLCPGCGARHVPAVLGDGRTVSCPVRLESPLGAIMALEQDETLSVADTLRYIAGLVASGDAWTLQGCYGRAAARAIEAGRITQDGRVVMGYDPDDDAEEGAEC